MSYAGRTFWFRTGLAALFLVGLIGTYAALHPRHRPSHDDGTTPKLPSAEAPAISR